MTALRDADAIANDRVVEAGARLADSFRPGADTFLFLRHGRTSANHKGIIQGHKNVPLDEVGRAQARAAASLFGAGGARPVRIIASDLSRAAETARIVATALDQRVGAYDRGLRERSFGPIEGTSGRGLVWSGDPEGAEPIAAFVARCAAALQRHLIAEPVLIVAHGGVLRATAALLRLPLSDADRANAVPLLFRRADGGWRLERVAEPAGQSVAAAVGQQR